MSQFFVAILGKHLLPFLERIYSKMKTFSPCYLYKTMWWWTNPHSSIILSQIWDICTWFSSTIVGNILRCLHSKIEFKLVWAKDLHFCISQRKCFVNITHFHHIVHFYANEMPWNKIIWAIMSETVPSDMCAQQRPKSACPSLRAD